MGDSDKKRHRDLLRDMIRKEVANSEDLLKLFESGIEFMATTNMGETPLIHGNNVVDLIHKKIKIMEDHIDDVPFIDPDFMERKAGRLIE